MCGRYTLVRMDRVTGMLPFVMEPLPPLAPRYNIAPSQAVAAVLNCHPPRVELLHWGLVPGWAKDITMGNRMINARAESLAAKPAFGRALRRQRCLILADGFFEWQVPADGKTKVPMYVTLKDGRPFCFAGLWDLWRHDGTELKSCTIITTAANALMQPIHDRMPAIVPPEGYTAWLDPGEQPAAALEKWLRPYPPAEMTARPVGRLVNDPRHDSPAVLAADDPPGTATAKRMNRQAELF